MVYQVLACALVGSVLFTDAIGLSQLSALLQYGTCTVLVLFSCYHQVCTPSLHSKPASCAAVQHSAAA